MFNALRGSSADRPRTDSTALIVWCLLPVNSTDSLAGLASTSLDHNMIYYGRFGGITDVIFGVYMESTSASAFNFELILIVKYIVLELAPSWKCSQSLRGLHTVYNTGYFTACDYHPRHRLPCLRICHFDRLSAEEGRRGTNAQLDGRSDRFLS
jgi:hypothetical protein